MSQYILAIDQGTTGTTVALVDRTGLIKAKVNYEFRQIFPKPGWVEHDLNDIWESVLKGINELLARANVSAQSVAAIGITNQRETTAVWDKHTGEPIYNAIVWQCRRTTERCEQIKKNKELTKKIKAKTGLVVDPYFSGSKFEWLLKNVKNSSSLIGGTIDTFLIWKLSHGKAHVTDVSNASRTMLMNIKIGEWDKDLLKLFKISDGLLPEIKSSSGIFGYTSAVPGLPDGIPISGVAGDQQAALFGQTCFSVGEAKCTFGTGSFLLMNTGPKMTLSRYGSLTTVAWRLQGDKNLTYALEGGAFVCGAAVQWLRDNLKIISTSSEIERLAHEVSDSAGVEFVPALTGLGAPYWRPEARGVITGITRGTTRAHIARATLDAMALQNVDILFAMQKDLGKKIRTVKVDGGASANNLLMQLQADYLNAPIERPKTIETTVAGASYLAGLGVGFWANKDEIKKVWQLDSQFKPKMSAKLQKARLTAWHKAIAKA
jgi:glycerol kinase